MKPRAHRRGDRYVVGVAPNSCVSVRVQDLSLDGAQDISPFRKKKTMGASEVQLELRHHLYREINRFLDEVPTVDAGAIALGGYAEAWEQRTHGVVEALGFRYGMRVMVFELAEIDDALVPKRLFRSGFAPSEAMKLAAKLAYAGALALGGG